MSRPDELRPSRVVQAWIGELISWRSTVDRSPAEVWTDEGVQHHATVLIALLMDRARLTTNDLPNVATENTAEVQVSAIAVAQDGSHSIAAE